MSDTRVVWKYILKVETFDALDMPRGAQVLTVQVQHGVPQLWALVDPTLELEQRAFFTVGTGHKFDVLPPFDYIGTYQVLDGDLVFHVFELRRS